MGKREGFFERFFKVSQSGSTMRTEVLAGITTFITIAYILILNPQILADPFAIVGNAEMASKVSNGVFIGRMSFVTDGTQNDLANDGTTKNQIFPLAIWFDESF